MDENNAATRAKAGDLLRRTHPAEVLLAQLRPRHRIAQQVLQPVLARVDRADDKAVHPDTAPATRGWGRTSVAGRRSPRPSARFHARRSMLERVVLHRPLLLEPAVAVIRVVMTSSLCLQCTLLDPARRGHPCLAWGWRQPRPFGQTHTLSLVATIGQDASGQWPWPETHVAVLPIAATAGRSGQTARSAPISQNI